MFVYRIAFLLQSKESSPPGDTAVPHESHNDNAAQKLKKEKEIEDEDLVARQARLQAEATMALAQVRLIDDLI